MTTLQAALIWVQQQNGKVLDFDNRWGGQCVDLYAYYSKFLGLQIQWVNGAAELWNRDIPGTRKVNEPMPGAIAVWTPQVGSGFGHCAIVLEVYKDGTFMSLDQNYVNFNIERGSHCAFIQHSMKNVAGFILPAFDNPPAAQQPAPAAPPAVPAPAPQPGGVWVSTERWPHKLSTLWGISMRMLGDGNRYMEIYNHPNNADMKAMRPDPNVIQPGDRWFVPQ